MLWKVKASSSVASLEAAYGERRAEGSTTESSAKRASRIATVAFDASRNIAFFRNRTSTVIDLQVAGDFRSNRWGWLALASDRWVRCGSERAGACQ